MKNMIGLELKKALSNKWFIAALCIGCGLSLASAVGDIFLFERWSAVIWNNVDTRFFPPASFSIYHYWIVLDISQPTTSLFYLLLPLLATIPYSWSYLSERKSGYALHLLAQSGRVPYLGSKLIAAFASGAIVIAAPLVLNMAVLLCFVPSCYQPDIYGGLQAVYQGSLWSGLYYTNPGLYCLAFFLLDCSFAGLWAAAVLALSSFVKNRIALLIAPFLFLILLSFLDEHLLIFLIPQDLTPFGYLRSMAIYSGYFTSGYTIIVEYAIIVAFTFLGALLALRRDDL